MRYFILITLLFLFPAIVFAQTTTTIEIEGSGNNCDEAKNDALRNAANKAYGSQVFSTTEIKNGVLISDDISLLTTGNILTYDVIKPCLKNNGIYFTTLKVTVSQTKLRNFIEGKGKSISVSGELIKQKFEQDVLSTKAELGIIKNLMFQLESFIGDPFDYNISSEKYSIKDSKYCELPVEITIKSNTNFYNSYLEIIKDVEKIAINETDRVYRSKNLNQSNYPLHLNSDVYYLRNKQSVDQIELFYKKLLEKIDDYTVVDGCLKELYLNENNKENKLDVNGGLFFPNPGFIVKTISGNYKVTIEEIGSLDRINIFAKHKLSDYKNGKSLFGELTLMKYSETNPLEFQALNNKLINSFEDLAKEKENGKIKVNYIISLSKDGLNNSSFQDIKVSQEKYKQFITTNVSQVKLNPSKLCGKFISTTDEIKLNFKWETYNNSVAHEKGKKSTYSEYFKSNKLPFGTYILTIKEKEFNSNIYKDIYISNYTTRGPINGLYSALIPGWGTRRVTYNDKSGWGRFWLVATPLALSITSKLISNSFYDKYMISTDQVAINNNFNTANILNKSSIVLGGLSASFYFYDVFWALSKGIKNVLNKKTIKQKIKKSEFQIQNQLLN
jgi:hypothetical protein